jgi:Lipase (class 3)
VHIEHLTAPSYQDLRPFKPATAPGFPVYPDLVDRLAGAGAPPDDEIRFVMAVCASYAYGDAATLGMMMTRLGLEKNRCLMVSVYVDAMFLTSVAYLIQSQDGRVVIVCYRGTPPTSAITWLTDLQVDPVRVAMPFPGPGGANASYDVHGGFYRNVRSTRHQIMDGLARALRGYSVEPDGDKLEREVEAIYITGHSLGGASAQMLAAMLFADPAYAPLLPKLKAAYTYGAPMIGTPEFARACDGVLGQKLIRYVYENDIVPQVPPTESGPFAHFGREYRFRASRGGWNESPVPCAQIHNLFAILATPASLMTRQLKITRRMRFKASLSDHFPQYYIDALTPSGVRSEFGN